METPDFRTERRDESRLCLIAILVIAFTNLSVPISRGEEAAIAPTIFGAGAATTCAAPNNSDGAGNSISGSPYEFVGTSPNWLDAIDPRVLAGALTGLDQTPNTGSIFRLRGRVDYDLISPSQNAASQQEFGDLQNTAGFRRARIGAEGNFSPASRYVAEIDLASGNVVIRDLYAGLGLVQDGGEFKFGHMREPFSLEGGTSANSFAFAERSLINILDPARNWGMGFNRCSVAEDRTIALGIFQSGTDASDLQYGIGCQTALTAKWTMLAWYEDHGKRLMHLGLAISERVSDYGFVVINQTPNSPLLDLGDSSTSPFVSKIKIPANFQQLINAQWALAYGSMWAQAEYYGTLIDQLGGAPVYFHGSHLDAGYFLTGEHRDYLTRTGVFGPVLVNRPFVSRFSSKQHPEELGYGAWEVACRISYLDFLDKNTPVGPQGQPLGTLLPQATVGVNWYLADRLRLMLDYTYAAPYEASSGWSNASVVTLRFATFW